MDFQFTHEQRIRAIRSQLHGKEVGREYTREHDASREFPRSCSRKWRSKAGSGCSWMRKMAVSAAIPSCSRCFAKPSQVQLDTAACIMTSISRRPTFRAMARPNRSGGIWCRFSPARPNLDFNQ